MKYIYKQMVDGKIKETEVDEERWQWGIIYKDGTELKQFESDGIFHRVDEIKQEEVAMAVLINNSTGQRVDLPWQPGMKLIYKYRHVHAHYFKNFNDTVKVYVFGYKLGGSVSYLFILPDDRMIVSPVDNIDLTKFELIA